MKILLAEDSAVYRHLIGTYLKEWGFDPIIARDGDEAWSLLRHPDAPSLVLLDWVLPGIDGIELCRRIRGHAIPGTYTYAILLTGRDGENDLVEGLQAGADDYLAKPFEPLELRARLFAGKRILNLQRELVDANESLRLAATYDFLTRLLNRAEIFAHLYRELDRGKRESKPVGIIMADIDHFKSVNDLFGHLVGDAVLKEVASRLKSDLRVYDAVGRYGGEEFLLILSDCDLDATLRRAESVRQLVSAEVINIGQVANKITISMGVTVAAPGGKASVEALLGEADEALYRAKKNGRDRVEGPISNTLSS